MPQDFHIAIPFPPRYSADAERARAVHLDWPRKLQLITTEAAAARHCKGDYADLAGWFYPTATGADLDLGVDLMSWFFLFDDQFDGPAGADPALAKQLTDAVIDAIERPLSDSHPRIAHALADVWRRSCEGMSPDFCARAARHWRGYIAGYVDEAASRHRAVPYDSNQYMAVRRKTIGVLPTIDMAERVGHCEVPKRIYESAVISALLQIAIDINVLFNDVASLEKEVARGEQNNLVLILMRENDWTQSRSIAHILQHELRARFDQFMLLEATLPQVYDSFNLDDDERDRTERFRLDGLRTVIRGSHDWHRSSGRYSAQFVREASEQGYLENLGIPA
jgi:pentalenene synthase